MKRIAWLLALCLLMTACADRRESSGQESSGDSVSGSSSQGNVMGEVPDEARLSEIMCIFGAEPRQDYDEDGNPTVPGNSGYRTSVVSFYYKEDGVPSAEDITPYGFYGWYLEYTSTREEEIRKVLPDFERMVVAKTTAISGEIYGAPADNYERIVTAFFDVDVEQLRGDDLYDEETHAYISIAGPGVGERSAVHVASAERQGDLILLDIVVESSYEPTHTFRLTVREDSGNQLEGIRFVSLVPVAAETP